VGGFEAVVGYLLLVRANATEKTPAGSIRLRSGQALRLRISQVRELLRSG
jgi:hypothetical protein